MFIFVIFLPNKPWYVDQVHMHNLLLHSNSTDIFINISSQIEDKH